MFPISTGDRQAGNSRSIQGPISAASSPMRTDLSPARHISPTRRNEGSTVLSRSPYRRLDDASPQRHQSSPYRALSSNSSTVTSPSRRRGASFLLPDGTSAIPARGDDYFSPTSKVSGQRIGGPLPAPPITADDVLDAASTAYSYPPADYRAYNHRTGGSGMLEVGGDISGIEVFSPYRRRDVTNDSGAAYTTNPTTTMYNATSSLPFPHFPDSRVADLGGSRGRVVVDYGAGRQQAPTMFDGSAAPPAEALHAAALSLRRQEEQLSIREEQLSIREAELERREVVLRKLVYEALDVTNPSNTLTGSVQGQKPGGTGAVTAGGPLAQQHAQRLASLREQVANMNQAVPSTTQQGGSNRGSAFVAASDAMTRRSAFAGSAEGVAYAHYDGLMGGSGNGGPSFTDASALNSFASTNPLRQQRSADLLNAMASVNSASQGVMGIAGEHMSHLRDELSRQRQQMRQVHDDLLHREKAVEAAALAVKRHEQRLQMRGMELDTRERALLAEEEGMVQDVQRHAHKISQSSEVMRRRIATLETKERDLEELVREIEAKDEELRKREQALAAGKEELGKSQEGVVATLHRAHELEHHARELEQATRRLRAREGALWNAVAEVTEQHTMRFLDSEDHIKELEDEIRRLRSAKGGDGVASRRPSIGPQSYIPRTPTASTKDKGMVSTPRGPSNAGFPSLADEDIVVPGATDQPTELADSDRLARMMAALRGVQDELTRARSAQLGSGALGSYSSEAPLHGAP